MIKWLLLPLLLSACHEEIQMEKYCTFVPFQINFVKDCTDDVGYMNISSVVAVAFNKL